MRPDALLIDAAAVARLRRAAQALGFDAVGLVDAANVPDIGVALQAHLSAGHHAGMAWMQTRAAQRAHPRALVPEVNTVIAVGMRLTPERSPLDDLQQVDCGNIAVYARGRDYHDVLKGRLKHLAQAVVREGGTLAKVFVDTAPVAEKNIAVAAGIGHRGKHSGLFSRTHGSWLLLGSLFTDLRLPAEASAAAGSDVCGRCTRCLDVCPTGAFVAPYQLDARKCLAYWNIEHADEIPVAFHAPMGNRIFGCDDCYAVCPWNKFAAAGVVRADSPLRAQPGRVLPPLIALLQLDEAGFRALTAGSAMRRLGYARFLRNCLIAASNAHDPATRTMVNAFVEHPLPLVRTTARQVLARLSDTQRLTSHA